MSTDTIKQITAATIAAAGIGGAATIATHEQAKQPEPPHVETREAEPLDTQPILRVKVQGNGAARPELDHSAGW